MGNKKFVSKQSSNKKSTVQCASVTDIEKGNGFLGQLPLDVLKHCLSFLDATSLCNFCQVNKFLYVLSSSETFWRSLLLQNFKHPPAFVESLEDEYKVICGIKTDDLSFNDIVNAIQTKPLLHSKHHYWKHMFLQLRKGFCWKPARKQEQIESGLNQLENRTIHIFYCGEVGVGNTSTIDRVLEKKIQQEELLGEMGIRNKYCFDRRTFTIEIPHPTGQESELSSNAAHVRRNSDGYIVLYAIDDVLSFHTARECIERMHRMEEEIPFVVVGNKNDLAAKRQVSIEQGLELAKQYDVPFFEASAKSRSNVDEVLFELLKEIAQKEEIKRNNLPKKKKEGCVLQ